MYLQTAPLRTTVHLVRHGEVDNPDGILYGRLPGYGLTSLGTAMAREVASAFETGGHDVRAVVSSPLQRARETATPTARAYGLPLLTDDRLIEAGNSFEGEAVHGSIAFLAQPKFWPRYVNPLRPSWGESYREIAERMRDAIQGALNLRTGGEVVLVSHQLSIWSVRRFLERRPLWHDPRRRQCSLASVTSLVFDDATLIGMNYWEPAAHLLSQARDVTPGASEAENHTGRE